MKICDRCRMATKTTEISFFHPTKHSTTLDLCEPCHEHITARRQAVLDNLNEPQSMTATETMAYALPERPSWWKRTLLPLMVLLGGIAYLAAGTMAFWKALILHH